MTLSRPGRKGLTLLVCLVLFLIPGCSPASAASLSPPGDSASASPETEVQTEQETETVMETEAEAEPEAPFTFYFQNDPLWADYPYGGRDPMYKYGCGPTAMAMAVTNLTDTPITPPQMADWAWENGYFSPGGGSAHALIPGAASAFGLNVETLSIRTPEALLTCLAYDKLLVLLMGPGQFTDGGHFILIYRANEDGSVKIADPNSPEHNEQDWDPADLLDELSGATDAGSPMWAISKKGLNG